MEVGIPKCCEGLKFIAKSTGIERFPFPPKSYCFSPFSMHVVVSPSLGGCARPWGRGKRAFHTRPWGGGLSALLAGARLVEPDQQRRREAFFKRLVRQLLIGGRMSW
jgi:hypothetical protein